MTALSYDWRASRQTRDRLFAAVQRPLPASTRALLKEAAYCIDTLALMAQMDALERAVRKREEKT